MTDKEEAAALPAQQSRKKVYNFTKDVYFPVQARSRLLYVRMQPYAPEDLMALLASLSSRVSTRETDVALIQEADGAKHLVPFFFEHFAGIIGMKTAQGDDVPLVEQMAWIKRNARLGIERAIVINGYGGLRVTEDETDPFADDVSRSVRTFQALYFPERDEVARVDMIHNLREETEHDVSRYTKAQGQSRIYTRRSEFERTRNYPEIDKIYDSMIVSIEGDAAFGESDAACTAETKPFWVKQVPFWHKDLVLSEYFREVQVKN
jgi:hypothetical protein